MQQIGQRVFVMHTLCRRRHGAVRQPTMGCPAPMCSFMPKYHCWPLRVWCMSGSRALSAFLVELGRGDDGCIHVVPVTLTALLQYWPYFGKRGFAAQLITSC